MDDEVPIACTLTAAELPRRLAEMTEIGTGGLLGVDGPVLLFRDDDENRERLRAVVAAESTCCAFLDLDLEQTVDGLALTITGPAEATPIGADLVSAFQGGTA